MGKGDKKSRRGKIIIGTFGVRRPKKKVHISEIKSKKSVKEVIIKEKKAPKEKKQPKEVKEIKEIKKIKEPKEETKTKVAPKKKKEEL